MVETRRKRRMFVTLSRPKSITPDSP